MSFKSLGLSPLVLQAIEEKGYKQPSPIQEQGIPVVLEGKDVMAAAQTGTGKTAAFTLPILSMFENTTPAAANNVKALILTPTRELAAQIDENIRSYGKHLNLKTQVVFGGVGINPQMIKLRRGVDILVATPGRLMDLYQQRAVKFSQLEILVLDEADRMLDMGFIHDIKKIMAILPKKRQNLLFSATFSDDIRKLAKTIVNNPVEISVNTKNSTATAVEQVIIPVDKTNKNTLLSHLIIENNWHQVLVFCRTKHGADRLAKFLIKKNISASAIHGNKSQGARTRALADFKSGKVQILAATDIAARGIDINELPQIVNFDLPNIPEDYVHRIGRTGRAGATGHAYSFATIEDKKNISDIQSLIGKVITTEVIKGFEPSEKLAPVALKAQKPKRPKAPKNTRFDGANGNREGRGDKPRQPRRK
ncbi:DEAD/DEAH box helicase [Brumicola pallidula]|jgi:ATP-dependent RNA helicase RhlE|uniref:DEAD-box ATP-dependent RNA helicase RhpA n=1 Tax=Brumicola pallidula DSM 14239 = ACAM 615 TaxID=1121922 RepID=K6Y5C5_9ALTE|nr:DEAD/DEAH box helicase [Glaciecola pallidula]GAC27989.1 ATP-dependent RNA helicase rhlB [Glaciecola pallidula DSM 14239 = ACAM 615]